MIKNILYITPFVPDYYQGGGRVCYLNLLALSHAGYKITYIGPEFEETDELRYDCFEKSYLIGKYHLIDKIKSLFFLTNVFSLFANRVLDNIKAQKFDLVFCESTRVKIFDHHLLQNQKVFTVVHNVEYDYYQFNSHGLIGKVKTLSIKRIEQRTLQLKNNMLIFFHQKDREKMAERYLYNSFESCILPVCIKKPNISLESEYKNELLFVGSLGIEYNHRGIVAFIKACMKDLSEFRLIIAGRGAKNELQELVKKFKNIELYQNPLDIEPFFAKRSIFLNPDMSGSGMKLKVAEALSYALPIVSTNLGAHGYEKLDQCGVVVENIVEFKDAIMTVNQNYEKYSRNSYLYFQSDFSFDNYEKSLIKLLENE